MNNMLEKEVLRARLRMIDLIKSFFLSEPDAETLSRWRGTFNALADENIGAGFDRCVVEICAALQTISLTELRQEYYKLFTDPFTDKGLQTTASFYLDGRSQGQALVAMRSFVMDRGIARKKEVMESEDSLVVLLDIYAGLIEDERADEASDAQQLQAQLLQEFLLPLVAGLREAAETNEFAHFYNHCCNFLHCYLEMEKEFVGVTAKA